MDAKDFITTEIKEKLALKNLPFDVDYRTIGIDSLDLISLTCSIENEYNIKFSSEDILNVLTINDLIKLTNLKINS